MELTITFLATGVAVLGYTFWRGRRYRGHSTLIEDLCTAYHCEDIDLSGDTRYTNCISFRWTMDNLVRKKHSGLGSRFQDLLFHNTLVTAMWFLLSFGIGILIFGVLLVRSIQVAGMSLIILLIGAFAILGSGEAKSSEQLLSMLQSHDIEELNEQDYAYAALARYSIKKGLILSFTVGLILIISSPWGELAPELLGWIIATFTVYMIWNPTMFLSEFSVPLALLYLTAVWPVLMVAIVYSIRRIRRSEEEIEERAPQG